MMDPATFHALTPGVKRDPLDPDSEPSWPDPAHPATPDMDPDRHFVECWFDGEPRPYKWGPLAFKLVCMAHGTPVFGRNPERCKAHALEHLAGKR